MSAHAITKRVTSIELTLGPAKENCLKVLSAPATCTLCGHDAAGKAALFFRVQVERMTVRDEQARPMEMPQSRHALPAVRARRAAAGRHRGRGETYLIL